MESFGLETRFNRDRIVYDDGRFRKKAEMFRYAASVIGVPVGNCLIFEDSESGIRNALEAGCRVVVVDSTGVAEQYVGQLGIVGIIKTIEELN